MDYRIAVDCEHPGCACIPQERTLTGVRLATAYVPFQKLCTVLPPMEALAAGTLFPELFSPYTKREFSCLEEDICHLPYDIRGRVPHD